MGQRGGRITELEHANELCKSRNHALGRKRRGGTFVGVIGQIVAAFVALTPLSMAQSRDWPSQPIRVISPFSAGGGGETLARVVMERLSRRFGQQFFTENRPGAGATLGAAIVAKARSDGHTLLVSGTSSLVIGPVFMDAPFDPINDFTHIALFGGLVQSLAVHPQFPAKTLRRYVDLSRATKEGIAFGSPGVGSHTHLIGEMFLALSGAKMFHVPYKGGGPLSQELAAGQIPSGFMTLAAASPLVRAGKLHLVALTAAKRIPDFPAVPTFLEAGYKEMVATTWFSLSGPSGLPREIVGRLNAEVRAALVQPDVSARLRTSGIETKDLDPDQFTEYVRTEIRRWAPLARTVRQAESTRP